jgi:hypothetical protein
MKVICKHLQSQASWYPKYCTVVSIASTLLVHACCDICRKNMFLHFATFFCVVTFAHSLLHWTELPTPCQYHCLLDIHISVYATPRCLLLHSSWLVCSVSWIHPFNHLYFPCFLTAPWTVFVWTALTYFVYACFIKMDLLEIGVSVVDWIGLAQDRYRWRALVNSVMILRVP